MIDFQDLIAAIERAKAAAVVEVDGIAAQALTAVRQGAEVEKATKTYQNRSGRLLRSTKGILVSRTKSLVRVQLEAGMHYAAAVNARGFMNIESAARDAASELEDRLRGMAGRVNARAKL